MCDQYLFAVVAGSWLKPSYILSKQQQQQQHRIHFTFSSADSIHLSKEILCGRKRIIKKSNKSPR